MKAMLRQKINYSPRVQNGVDLRLKATIPRDEHAVGWPASTVAEPPGSPGRRSADDASPRPL